MAFTYKMATGDAAAPEPLTVIKYNGAKEFRKHCINIDGKWYHKTEDAICHPYLGWIPKTTIFDEELQINTILTNEHMRGVVSFDNNKKPVMGYYTPNIYKNCTININGNIYPFIDVDKLPNYFIEEYSTGVYYDTNYLTKDKVLDLQNKKLSVDNANKTYNADDNKNAFKNSIENYEKYKLKIDKDLRYAAHYLGDLTFGIELETINGTLPDHLCNRYGIIICKDGSIKNNGGAYPPEYVTIPYSGSKGLQSIRNITKEISLRSEININCSYHLHLGVKSFKRIDFVSLFRLCYKIQEELFNMFPGYKSNHSGIKQQNYCKKLSNVINSFGKKDFKEYIETAYRDLYYFLSGGKDFDHNHKKGQNPWGQNKWDIKTRYYWVNFVNPLFGKRETIEFRLHTPTLNEHKIINWLFICNAILKFASKYPERCCNKEKITMEEVLMYYSNTFKTPYAKHISNQLIAYYKERVGYFYKDKLRGDKVSNAELITDNEYTFNITKYY